MTNESINHHPLPDTDACAIILRDTLLAATDYLTHAARRITDSILNPYELISDSDDYAPAAASIAYRITLNAFNSDHDDARAALDFLLNDSDFRDDCLTCDFDAPIHAFIPDNDDD